MYIHFGTRTMTGRGTSPTRRLSTATRRGIIVTAQLPKTASGNKLAQLDLDPDLEGNTQV